MDEDLCYRTATDLAAMIAARKVSAREVLRAHLDRVDAVNPALNAIVTIDADRAERDALDIDERLAHGETVGPLAGLPIAHKDTHQTAGIRTTFGSPLFRDNVPLHDELIVERVRAAGAVTFGKTNVPEFASGSHTFNTVFGATHNPYAVGRSAGGSSGGAAAALAAGMQPIADGSDMGGSLRNPASFCNVVGFRPSPGRVPSHPSAWPWGTLAVQGPLARTVPDVALLMSVMAGDDPRAPIALTDDPAAFRRPLHREMSGLKVAWTPDFAGQLAVDPSVTRVLESSLAAFANQGCRIEQASPNLTDADDAFRTLRAWQFAGSYRQMLAAHRDDMKPSFVWNIEQGLDLTGEQVAGAFAAKARVHEEMRRFFERFDVLLAPVSQVPPFPIDWEYPTEIAGQAQHTYLDWMRSAYLISLTGCPALSVPAGFTDDGLPVGLQIIGPLHADLDVLRIGHMFEQATGFGARRPPLDAA